MEKAFLYGLLGPLAALGVIWLGRAARRRYEQQYASYRAGELARRLGLTLVEGDPAFNLFIQRAPLRPSLGGPAHVQILMRGQPHGVPLELTYLLRVESGLLDTTERTRFDCRMTAHAGRPFPPFEVTSREAPLGPMARMLPLPPTSTGNPMADARYLVSARERAVAELLGPALGRLGPLADVGVHLVGDGERISFVMHRDRTPMLASALYYGEAMAALLSDLARRIGG